jgi:DinB superfamily
MNMSQANHDNPEVAAIRADAGRSYEALTRLVDDTLERLQEEQLYLSPGEGAWTIMENLAHINEFMPYWADEIAALVAQPGKNFGRTQQHEGRLRAISEHGHDTLAHARVELPGSYAHLDEVLASLHDSDLEITGVHVRYGEQSLAWFIEEFVTGHLRAHLEQMQAVLETLR